jgi:hypothetical protein
MKRWLIIILLVAGAAAAFAGSFRFGTQFGMTSLFGFNHVEVAAPVNKELWLDYITSLDLRFHFFGPRAFPDPFVEAGFGTAGRSNVTDYEAVGARLGWRFWNAAVPGTSFNLYPLKNFSVALFAGLVF